jgi:peptidoglycan/xylan/chitin deacetylase (PgdA/CDA1 family)
MQPAIALTFDNLGEAADLERGLWNEANPLGRHPSVTIALPRLLDELDTLDLRATFCVEALNCELHPAAVRDIHARGHELALHGWRHERWDALTPADEDETLARGREAFAALGIDVEGFRPPGGELTPSSPRLLCAHGFRWCSAAGGSARREGGLAHVPFAWALVDAYHVLPSFASLRGRLGDPGQPASPDEAARRVTGALDGVAGASNDPPAAQSVILHPFLMVDDEGWAAARRVLRHVRRLADHGRASVAPAGDIARMLR